MIDKPGDLVIIFAIVALITLTAGNLYTDALLSSTATAENRTMIYSSMEAYVNDPAYFKGASDDVSNSLNFTDTGGGLTNFITEMSKSLLSMGKIWGAMAHTTGEFISELGLAPYFITIIIGSLLILLALAIFWWWRGP